MTRKKDARAHPYPFQIGMQTLEFIQGAIMHTVFMDVACGQRIRLPNGMAEVERELVEKGLDPKDHDKTWGILIKYQDLFSKFAYQNVLISMRSHWDWYIDKLGAFTVFALSEIDSPNISQSMKNKLKRIGFSSISEQIEILEQCVSISFSFDSTTMGHVVEMALVRNLGIHNRWEVNKFYLERTQTAADWQIGSIRDFGVQELERWHDSLTRMINATSIQIAEYYSRVSDYP